MASPIPQPDIWNPLNVFLTLIAIIVTIVLYRLSRKKKSLSYTLISNTSVVSINKEFAEKVDIRYLGIPTKTMQLIRFKITNTGNVPIRKEDFEEPITFLPRKENKKGKMNGFYVVDFPNSRHLHPELMNYGDRLGIKPLLLNNGDTLIVEVLNVDIDKSDVVPEIQGRIVGVNRIDEKKVDATSFSFSDIGLILGFSTITVSILLFFLPSMKINLQTLLTVIPAALGMAFATLLSASKKSKRVEP